MPRTRHGRFRRALQRLGALPGPGVVTGASDDDPSGIATYSAAGAQTGYHLLWTSLLTLPLNAAIQEMCARIGVVTGGGLATQLRRHYPRPLLMALVLLLFVANTVNIGADIAAVAAGIALLTPIPQGLIVPFVAVGIAATEIAVPYHIYATYLRALTLVLFAYVVDAFVASPDWAKALRSTFVPHIELNRSFLTTVVAVLGTTISPYLFFWQTSEEAEEIHQHHASHGSEPELRRAQIDTHAGMLLANVVFYFIVLTTAATLYPKGITELKTASDAAEALRPLAGDGATILFAIGFIGTGLLSIPVLAGSAAYAVAEVFDWREGLENSPRQAPQFYLVIAIATFIGLLIALSGVGAIRGVVRGSRHQRHRIAGAHRRHRRREQRWARARQASQRAAVERRGGCSSGRNGGCSSRHGPGVGLALIRCKHVLQESSATGYGTLPLHPAATYHQRHDHPLPQHDVGAAGPLRRRYARLCAAGARTGLQRRRGQPLHGTRGVRAAALLPRGAHFVDPRAGAPGP
jgi:NRAMP (natural resistance-associated macrophage protein)-like metal ion transporter